MPAIIVSDTSCLILLHKIDELHLLQKLFGEVTITQIVAGEFGTALPAWIRVENPADRKNQLVLEATLDKGEASSIALALEKEDCLLIIDDLKGRKLARRFGLIITGTLGILAQTKRKKHIPLLKSLLDKIKRTDFRLSEELILETLKQVGE
jgi:predicted nucleic acid-binding protein